MSAYVIVEIDVHDPVRYEEYKKLAAPTVTDHGGRYVVRGGATEVLEGEWEPRRVVVLEFATMDGAKRWWSSPEYEEAKRIRHATATTKMLLVDGT